MLPGGALLLALLSQSAGGAAEGAPSTRARLDVRGGMECLSAPDLAARVASRSNRIQFVGDAAISAQVALVSARPGSVVAELVLTASGAEQPARRIVARSCAEAADAVALIIAVTLDPTAKRKPATDGGDAAPRSTNRPPAPPAAVKPAEPPAPADPAEPPVVDKLAKPAAPPVVVTPAASPVEPAVRRRFGVYLAGQAIFGPAPSVMPGFTLQGMAALDRAGLWAPAVIVGASHVWRSELGQTGGTASFSFDAASLDACPLRLRWSRLAAWPCASALVGRLGASGSLTDHAASSARPFAVAGAAVTATAGSTVALFVRLAVGATLVRDSYEFGTDIFYRAGRVTTSASLGLGVHLP